MADRTWTCAAGDGNYQTKGNWSPEPASDGGPLDGENIYFRDNAVSVTSGLTPPIASDNPASLNILPSYTGSIGASGSPLTFDTLTTLMMSGSGPEFWIKSKITNAQCGPRHMGDNACQIEIDTGQAIVLTATNGKVQIEGTSVLDSGSQVFVIPEASAGEGNCLLVINAGVSWVADLLHIQGGRIWNNVGFDSGERLLISGGRFVHLAGTVNQADVSSGGILQHDGGTITTAIVNGGTYDSSKSAVAAKSVGTIKAFGPQSIVNLRNRGGVAKPSTLVVYGNPRVIFDDGQSLTLN